MKVSQIRVKGQSEVPGSLLVQQRADRMGVLLWRALLLWSSVHSHGARLLGSDGVCSLTSAAFRVI